MLCYEQSSQVDLLVKSEIFDGVDIVGDTACVTPPERSGAPQGNFEKLK